jgi:membrane-associated phospholipid phosphatase
VAGHESSLTVSLNEREVAALVTAQRLATPPVTRQGAVAASNVGEHAMAWVGLGLLGAALDPDQRRLWLRATATVVSAHAVSVVVKRVVRRRRPSDPRIQVLVTTPSQCSFPSSHATSTTAAAVAYSRLLGRRWPLLSIPVMMASRLVLGVHYPSDVLAGALLGAGIARWPARSRTRSWS